MSTSIDNAAKNWTLEAEVLRNGVHVLTTVLLVVCIASSLEMPLTQAALNLGLLSSFAVIYLVGSRYLEHAPKVATWGWITLLTIVWVGDLFVSRAAVYLIFTLFFVYLRVLEFGVGVVAVLLATGVAIGKQIPDGLTFGGVMGPAVSALVTIAITYALGAMAKISADREDLIQELVETRSQLAESEHTAGVNAERQRIAHEIHDTIAQGLSSIQMLLHAADRDLNAGDTARGRERIELARRTAADNLLEARAMIAALQPAGLATTSLASALERMADGFAGAGEMTIDVDVEGTQQQLPMCIEATLLRVAQGAVGNIVKHSGASKARVTLTYNPDEVRVDVVDNGRGFIPDTQPNEPGHVGLAAMRRRAAEVGGELTIESTPGDGTAVSVCLPLVGDVD
ncbi:sensor histidine kinase [Corynebacterium massiliense]|uniref:Sensor histidine kinase LiaS n=1 Tax=Corynebacterium massiliense DSM 45435 TaxID=1121364 RepID=A0ABY7UBY8_9CORY|nr:sensor histidine kinase [Corynebacterium massiliense]WCZ33387.1 Sensor histidine kinase LiaS [Corynebacterium massiliense DSM 45435]